MKITPTAIADVKLIEPRAIRDHRGYFCRSFSSQDLIDNSILEDWPQENHSYSQKKGTLRGLHFQMDPYAQAKLLRCTRGGILDVAVDIRKGSPTYGKWISVELTAENFLQIYIPAGFAHGFLALTDDVEVQYKTSACYAPDYDRAIRWNDPDIGVQWGVENPILSDKDKNAPFLREMDAGFIWKGNA